MRIFVAKWSVLRLTLHELYESRKRRPFFGDRHMRIFFAINLLFVVCLVTAPMQTATILRPHEASPPTDPSPGPTDPTPKPSGPIPPPQPPVPKPNPSHPLLSPHLGSA